MHYDTGGVCYLEHISSVGLDRIIYDTKCSGLAVVQSCRRSCWLLASGTRTLFPHLLPYGKLPHKLYETRGASIAELFDRSTLTATDLVRRSAFFSRFAWGCQQSGRSSSSAMRLRMIRHGDEHAARRPKNLLIETLGKGRAPSSKAPPIPHLDFSIEKWPDRTTKATGTNCDDRRRESCWHLRLGC
jgi:hypothetical protein